jgi:hypothetical protein
MTALMGVGGLRGMPKEWSALILSGRDLFAAVEGRTVKLFWMQPVARSWLYLTWEGCLMRMSEDLRKAYCLYKHKKKCQKWFSKLTSAVVAL